MKLPEVPNTGLILLPKDISLRVLLGPFSQDLLMLCHKLISSMLLPGRRLGLGKLRVQLSEQAKVVFFALYAVHLMGLLLQIDIDEHMSDVLVVMVQGIGHGDQGD